MAEREHLRAHNRILEDEGYLAHEINRGRRLLDVPEIYEPIPDVAPQRDAPGGIEQLSDAIAAVLQVAVEAGYDPIEVCDAALATQQSVRRHASAAIRR
ncbi:MAG: hypothetical protein U0R78_02405 [Nocardioidaceae bacterium]